MMPGDLDGILYRFTAGGEEQGLTIEVAWCKCIEAFGERDIAFIRADLETSVSQIVELGLDCIYDALMPVATFWQPMPPQKSM